MPGDINAIITLAVTSNNAGITATASVTQTLAGNNYQALVQDVGSGVESLVVDTDIGTGGWLMVKNQNTLATSDTDTETGTLLSSTGYSYRYVDVFLCTAASLTATSNRLGRLYPGEGVLVKPEIGLFAKAAAAYTGSLVQPVLVAASEP